MMTKRERELAAEMERVEQERRRKREAQRKSETRMRKSLNRAYYVIGEKVVKAFPPLLKLEASGYGIELERLDTILSQAKERTHTSAAK